jgi:hypothetical protein
LSEQFNVADSLPRRRTYNLDSRTIVIPKLHRMRGKGINVSSHGSFEAGYIDSRSVSRVWPAAIRAAEWAAVRTTVRTAAAVRLWAAAWPVPTMYARPISQVGLLVDSSFDQMDLHTGSSSNRATTVDQ